MSDEQSFTPDVLSRLDEVFDRFESVWRTGQPRLEEFLAEAPESERMLWLRGLLEIEFEVLRSRGISLRLDDYLYRFPGLEHVVHAAFDPGSRLFGTGIPQGSFDTLSPSATIPEQLTQIPLPLPGNLFGRYEIRRELGRGAMGAVYLAYDPQLQRLVALKVPNLERITKTDGRSRFLREARAAALLHHRHLCPVFDVGEVDGLPFMTMVYLDGGPLTITIGQQLTFEHIARLIDKIAQALDYAHRQGIVHRDLKPSNILFDSDMEPVVTDFGLARVEESSDETSTATGMIVGSPAYMSPEQAMGRANQSDARMDIYSIGVILYQLLTGELPFRGDTHALIHQVIYDDPPAPRSLNLAVPRDIETICLKCLAKEPRRRYFTAKELSADLNRFINGRPTHARPVGRFERLNRWAKRNPLVAGLTVSLAVVLITGTTVSTLLAFQASEKTRQAVKLQVQAEDAAKQLMHLIRTLRLVSDVHNPINLDSFRNRPNPVESPELKALLKDGSQRLKILNQSPKSLAEMLNAVGTVCRGIGEYDLALNYLDQAIQIYRRLGPEGKRDLADSLVQYGWLKRETGNYAEAEKALREALSLNDNRVADRRFYAITEFHLAWILADRGSREDPKLLKEGLSRFEAVADQIKLISGDRSRDYAVALLGLAIAYFANGLDHLAIEKLLQSQNRFQTQADHSIEPVTKVAALYTSATLARKAGRPIEAEKHFRDAIRMAHEIAGEQHPFLRLPIAFLEADFAGLLRDIGKLNEAEKLAREVLTTIRKSPVRGHLEVIRALHQFADLLRSRGNPEDLREAETYYADAASFGSVSLGKDHHFIVDAQAKLTAVRKELNALKK